jgi:hypothetical protein
MDWHGLGRNLLVCFEVNREGLPRLNEVQTEVHLCKSSYYTRNYTKKGINNKETDLVHLAKAGQGLDKEHDAVNDRTNGPPEDASHE